MAAFSDRHKQRSSKAPNEGPDAIPVQLTGLLSLVEVLCGYQRTPGDWIDGMSLTMWVDDGKVKGCINDKANGESGFFTLRQAVPLGDAIEAELEAGDVEWKVKPSGKR